MKFCILSPLKSKRAEEVASKLLEMFLMLLLLKLKTVHNEKLNQFTLNCSAVKERFVTRLHILMFYG
ncbi:hypothetical protein T05_10563 [Trichinella murrelli]|uniref:Uncharacterized protein n=1 Tax=Trichinella murrelli TaxID=144512 RepID=A0A0V0T355_9BILA|nr:hypothetical protein T05_10563 [Trichinella murrelli]